VEITLITEGMFAFASKNEVTLFSLKERMVVGVLSGHRNRVRTVRFLKDRQTRLISGGDDHQLCCWDTVTSEVVAQLELHQVSAGSCYNSSRIL
jgi:WD40 repeat protein